MYAVVTTNRKQDWQQQREMRTEGNSNHKGQKLETGNTAIEKSKETETKQNK